VSKGLSRGVRQGLQGGAHLIIVISLYCIVIINEKSRFVELFWINDVRRRRRRRKFGGDWWVGEL
jgi:hypothetical protein